MYFSVYIQKNTVYVSVWYLFSIDNYKKALSAEDGFCIYTETYNDAGPPWE
jgi:hypothetical protein